LSLELSDAKVYALEIRARLGLLGQSYLPGLQMTLNPAPYTPNLQPYTLHPTPCTLHRTL